MIAAPVSLMDENSVNCLVATVQAVRDNGYHPHVVAFDTLARNMRGGDENSTRDMGIAVANSALIQQALGCCVLAVHHSGKDEARGLRGSNALFGAVDTLLRITRDELSLTLLVEAQKDGMDGQDFSFTAKVIDLPPEEDGKPRSSLVVLATTPTSDTPTRKKSAEPNMPKQQRMALRILTDLIASEGTPLPERSGFPTQTTPPILGVPIARWRAECHDAVYPAPRKPIAAARRLPGVSTGFSNANSRLVVISSSGSHRTDHDRTGPPDISDIPPKRGEMSCPVCPV